MTNTGTWKKIIIKIDFEMKTYQSSFDPVGVT